MRSKWSSCLRRTGDGSEKKIKIRWAIPGVLYWEEGDRPVPTKDLYRSKLIVLARAWVERKAALWFILPARHGVVHPNTVMAPYDETLNNMPVAARRDWTERVKLQMDETLPDAMRKRWSFSRVDETGKTSRIICEHVSSPQWCQ